jgi:hypothetical protein
MPWCPSTPISPPIDLLRQLLAIEARHGRVRSVPNAPRTLDLDLLLHGEALLQGSELTLPHPRMHQRAFVLRPLLEIAADLTLPGLGPPGTTYPASPTRTSASSSPCNADLGPDRPVAGGIQRVHDLRLVRAPEKPVHLALVHRGL